MKYRKKPLVVEALQFLNGDGSNNIRDCLLFLGGDLSMSFFRDEDGGITVNTPEGSMRVNNRDYIIKGVKGELYPCNPGIFKLTYEKL